jgi:uncharacterized protein (DUF1778 family)
MTASVEVMLEPSERAIIESAARIRGIKMSELVRAAVIPFARKIVANEISKENQ